MRNILSNLSEIIPIINHASFYWIEIIAETFIVSKSDDDDDNDNDDDDNEKGVEIDAFLQ